MPKGEAKGHYPAIQSLPIAHKSWGYLTDFLFCVWTCTLPVGTTSVSSVEAALEGFRLSSKPVKPKLVYPPPQLPRDFRPYHMTMSATDKIQQHTDVVTGGTASDGTPKTAQGSRHKMDASSRATILGETPQISECSSVH